MKKLIIVEGPAKIKTISKFLSSDFTVTATSGHIKDLPKNILGIEIEEDNTISMIYETLEKKDKIIKDIIKKASDADIIYIASDPDREGELIAWHMWDELSKKYKKSKTILRITTNEITKKGIQEAIKKPREIDMNLVAAQQARRILDRWVGYLVSPILWKKIATGLSAGRVQSVALKMIYLRELEIKNFKIEEYWSIHACCNLNKKIITSDLFKINDKKVEIDNEKDATKILNSCKEHIYHITDIKDSKRIKKPAAPFITSTLQQAAYNQSGFSVQQTMQIAQKLYEGILFKGETSALITYIRTDSTRISEEALKEVRTYINDEYGEKYLPEKPFLYVKNEGQDAHEAIRPIDVSITPEMIKPEVDKETYILYSLIWKRFVASQLNPAEYAQRQILIENIDQKKDKFTFKINGSSIIFDGFLKVYKDDEDNEEGEQKTLPQDLEINQKIDITEFKPKQHFTEPPARYSQATLIKELESQQIGRPSTYATIMKTIQERAYTYLDDKKRFAPTELGSKVIELLDVHMKKIMDIAFTAKMEENLDKIAYGKINRDNLLHDFYNDFAKDVEAFADKKIEKVRQETNFICQEKDCGGKLLIKTSKTGQFLGCEHYPKCTFTSNFTRTTDGTIEIAQASSVTMLDEKCPQCDKSLQERVGRYGKFVSCSGYPTCKYILQRKTKALCPTCGEGSLIKRMWKGRVFWGCEKYPTCKFVISGDIVEKKCQTCNFPFMMIKIINNENRSVCANKDCYYTENVE